MAMSHTDGPMTAGTIPAGSAKRANIGSAVLSQSVTLNQNGVGTVDGILALPAGAQIVDILVDANTAFDSATSATLTVGTASTGAQYASGVNAKTGGRQRPSFTAAQTAAMANIGTNTDVYVSIVTVGATTAGSVLATVLYVQK